jgi:hypothetical protein
MAKLKSPFEFVGTIHGFTTYRLPGVDGIVVRRKGGVPGHVIRSSPAFANSRRVTSELSGRSNASGWIMRMMNPIHGLADHPIGGKLNGLLTPVQKLDTESDWGKRHVILSKNRSLLEGFSLNNDYPLSYIVRTPTVCELSRQQFTGAVSFPELYPKINFFPSPAASFYSVVATLGVVPDIFYSPKGFAPSHDAYADIRPEVAVSSWYPCLDGSPTFDLSLQLQTPPPDENFSLILSLGIRYGLPTAGNRIQQKPKSGCGRIMLVR